MRTYRSSGRASIIFMPYTQLTSYRFPGESMHTFLAEELSNFFSLRKWEAVIQKKLCQVSVSKCLWVSILFDDLLLVSFFIDLWLENVVCILVLGNVPYRSIFLCLGMMAFYSPWFTLSLMLLGPGFRQWYQTPYRKETEVPGHKQRVDMPRSTDGLIAY